jgi:hypothetical protein
VYESFIFALKIKNNAELDYSFVSHLSYQCRCLESKKKTRDELAAKYLQPLGVPRTHKK